MRFQLVLTPQNKILLAAAKAENQRLLILAQKQYTDATTIFDQTEAVLKSLEGLVDDEELPIESWKSAKSEYEQARKEVEGFQFVEKWLREFEQFSQRTYSTQEYTWLAQNLQRRFPELDKVIQAITIVDPTPDVTPKNYGATPKEPFWTLFLKHYYLKSQMEKASKKKNNNKENDPSLDPNKIKNQLKSKRIF